MDFSVLHGHASFAGCSGPAINQPGEYAFANAGLRPGTLECLKPSGGRTSSQDDWCMNASARFTPRRLATTLVPNKVFCSLFVMSVCSVCPSVCFFVGISASRGGVSLDLESRLFSSTRRRKLIDRGRYEYFGLPSGALTSDARKLFGRGAVYVKVRNQARVWARDRFLYTMPSVEETALLPE
jgi:hypothetical protein